MSGNQQFQGQQNPLSGFGFNTATPGLTNKDTSTDTLQKTSLFGGGGLGTNKDASTDTPQKGSLFGGGGLGTNKDASTDTPQKGSLFGGGGLGTNKDASTDAPQKPSLFGGGGLSIGKDASTNTPQKPSLFGGGGLGTNKDASTDTPQKGSPFGGGGLGTNKDASTDTPQKAPFFGGGGLSIGKDASTNVPQNAPLFGGGGFATTNKDIPAPKSSETSGNTAAPNPAAPTTAPPGGASVPAPSIPAPSVPAPSMLRGKTVEDIVNRWSSELETHTREFSQFASEVAVWDRTLIENGNYISALYATVLSAESTQASLGQSLDHVEQQQRHLTATLDQYERSASEILHGPGGIMSSTEGLGLADSERDKSYALAANLCTQLDDLSRSLTQMVESVNSLNLSPGPSGTTDDGSQEDAISTIAGILNAHLSSLQWIDGSLKDMEGKIKDAERKIKDTGARGGARSSTDTDEGNRRNRGYGLGSSRR